MKINGKVYRTVVRSALMYGAETWALKKAQEHKLEVAEMRICGVTKLDKIRNERIRGTTKVGEITKKVQERRLKWYGQVMRREEHYVGRRAIEMKVHGRRNRGRPKRRWLDKVMMTSKRRDCRLIKCTTVLHGDICHRTSTPHIGGNTMKEKKKLLEQLMESGIGRGSRFQTHLTGDGQLKRLGGSIEIVQWITPLSMQ